MEITVRKATLADAEGMASMLNEIIAIGGTTAFLTPIDSATIKDWMAKDGDTATWFVAVNELWKIVGYQSAEPHHKLPKEAANIASFVDVNEVGRGIGSLLFEQTTKALRARGYVWINASIRSDNASGLSYYSKMGFKNWKIDPDAQLSDGRICGKHHKRFDL